MKKASLPRKRARAAAAFIMLAVAFVLASSVASPPPAAADQTAPKQVTCEETIPKGAKRPKMKEKFPGEVVAGFGASLELEILHGKGEKPLPNGFKVVQSTGPGKFLEEAGFLVAEPQGSSGVVVETQEDENAAITRVTIPFVVAPIKSGNVSLTMPRLPIQIDRPNGQTMVVCTQMHLVTALDPTAAEEDPMPRPNPPARRQIEPWPLMKWIMAALAALIVASMILAWWVRRQMKKPVPEPIPIPKLPWEQALAELETHKSSSDLEPRIDAPKDRTELFDRVSDTLRKYLGARYGFEGLGFDGLETTTDEMMSLLRRVRPGVTRLDLVSSFLRECDLVKFARVVPEASDCRTAIERAEAIVRATTPPPPAPPTAPGAASVVTSQEPRP